MGPAAELAAVCACALALCACGSKSGLPDRVGPPCTVDAECDDGVACNGPERCLDAVCVHTPWLTCDDGDPCTVDRCDEPAGRPHRDLRVDADRDGYDVRVAIDCGDDCDDARADVHPGATEVCNGVDDDCNGLVDEGARYAPVGGVVPVATSPAMEASG